MPITYFFVLTCRGLHSPEGPKPEDPAKPPVVFRKSVHVAGQLDAGPVREWVFLDSYSTETYLPISTPTTAPFTRYESATDFALDTCVRRLGHSLSSDADGSRIH